MPISIDAVGVIRTPYTSLAQCPRNSDPTGPACQLVIKPELADAIMGLSVGQKILILYWLDGGDRSRLQQNSRGTGERAGVFALRTPNRPNPIGAAVLPIESIAGNSITVRGLDCLDGTALLDLKPAKADE
jgi:tRNA-Thr(GGU) m(6)t(6)A37 methyltransferase TsaA